MIFRYKFFALALPLAALVLAGCENGPAASGSFDRSYKVTGPLLLELTNASGDVSITGSADAKVHVHAEVRASGMGFDNPQKRIADTINNPPIEQRGDTIHVGIEMARMRNITIAYTIQVPHDTQVSSTVGSGVQTIRGVRGPVKIQSAAGAINVEKIDDDVQLTTASGAVSASDIGREVRINSASGSVDVSNAKGDVHVNAIAGTIHVTKPGARVDADTSSGEVNVVGAAGNVMAHALSGRVAVSGNPGTDGYWDLKTLSGGVQVGLPASANIHLSAEATSGEIRADIPIVVEEQDKHSLRAHLGNGGGRVDVHTVSGEIHLNGIK